MNPHTEELEDAVAAVRKEASQLEIFAKEMQKEIDNCKRDIKTVLTILAARNQL